MAGSNGVIDPMVPPAKDQMITKEKIERLLPKGASHKVTDEVMNMIARMEDDVGVKQEYLEESFLGHLSVLGDIKVDLMTYINAIKFCNLSRSMSNINAWSIVFPERYKLLVDRGRDPSGDVSIYNTRPIVTKIRAMMTTAVSLQYAPEFHEALGVQLKIIRNPDDYSGMVQHLAAKTILEITKPIETDNVIATKVEKGSIIDEYEKAFGMAAMAKLQAIKDGADVTNAINAPIRSENDAIEAELVYDAAITSEFNPDLHDQYLYDNYGEIRLKKK